MNFILKIKDKYLKIILLDDYWSKYFKYDFQSLYVIISNYDRHCI